MAVLHVQMAGSVGDAFTWGVPEAADGSGVWWWWRNLCSVVFDVCEYTCSGGMSLV